MRPEERQASSFNPVADRCVVQNVTHRYGSRTALFEVSFNVHRGQMVAILGPSGSGKTTLLRIISGMLRPHSGLVELYGVRPHETRNAAERTRLVGMMQQRLDLVPQLSARTNANAGMLGRWGLLRSLAGLTLPLRHQPTESALARVGLAGRESERLSRLSGGEQQRVAMARMLVQDPEVIVADEPVASLDPALADELLLLLKHIAVERDRTVLASIHDPQLALAHFDRVIGLREGAVEFDLLPSEVTSEKLSGLYMRDSTTQQQISRSDDERPLWGI